MEKGVKVLKVRVKIPTGYFEFSLPQKRETDLSGWKNWFSEKDIKTKTIKNSKGEFILCREGTPATDGGR